MGVSTDAILCYGFQFKDEEGREKEGAPEWLIDEATGEEMMLDDFLARLVGLPEPLEHFDEERYASDPAYKSAWSEHWKRKRALEDEHGVEIVLHCSDSYPMYILAVKASVQTASRGSLIELGQALSVGPEWRETIRSFCERAKIPFEEPQLILCSYWG